MSRFIAVDHCLWPGNYHLMLSFPANTCTLYLVVLLCSIIAKPKLNYCKVVISQLRGKLLIVRYQSITKIQCVRNPEYSWCQSYKQILGGDGVYLQLVLCYRAYNSQWTHTFTPHQHHHIKINSCILLQKIAGNFNHRPLKHRKCFLWFVG